MFGADLNPLPVPRARLLLEPAARMAGVDRSLIDRVAARFDELETIDPLGERALAERGGGGVVHGEAHPMNVLWDDLDHDRINGGCRVRLIQRPAPTSRLSRRAPRSVIRLGCLFRHRRPGGRAPVGWNERL